MRKKIPPLIIDNIEELDNLYLLSNIEYHRQNYTCIIDNITSNEIKAYTLDNKYKDLSNLIITEAIYWFYNSSSKHSFSIHLAKQGLSDDAFALYKNFNIPGISRVVGKVFKFDHFTKPKIKKRRVLPISAGVEVKFKK
jgi:hypothetical protein